MNRRDFLLGASAAAGGTVAASGAAAAQEGGGGGGGGGSTKTVTVGPGGQLVFEPETLTVSPGTAVKFVWESPGHNVVPESGDWGHEPLEDSGFSFTTKPFQSEGSQAYFCAPHQSAGMEGTIEVGSSGGGGGGEEEEVDPEEMGVPFQAHFVGIATILMMVVSLIYTFFLVKYGESPNAKGGNN